ncbi:MAG: protease complex subunit PrcB family protein [Fimbriimonas sp.]
MSSLATLTALAALVLTPAAPAQGQAGGSAWNAQNQVNFNAFRTGITSQITNAGLIEISSEADFQAYWARSTGQAPQTAPQGIDWNRQKLIAIHLGQRRSGGYSVVVQSIRRTGAFAVVSAVERKPAPNQYVAQMITSPYVLVKVDRISIPFRLSMTEREGGQIPGGRIIVTDPGTVIVNPSDHSQRHGGGTMDPRFDVDWGNYSSGNFSHQFKGGVYSIDTPQQWAAYWSRLSRRPAEQAPGGVDWLKYRLVAVHLGERRTGGYGVKVLRVDRNGVYGIIRAVEETPVPGSFVTQAVTSPYTIIRVPRNLVRFELDLTKREPGNVRVID